MGGVRKQLFLFGSFPPLVDPKNLTQVMRLKSLNHLHSCYFFKFTFNFLFLFQPSKIRCFVTFEMKMYFLICYDLVCMYVREHTCGGLKTSSWGRSLLPPSRGHQGCQTFREHKGFLPTGSSHWPMKSDFR